MGRCPSSGGLKARGEKRGAPPEVATSDLGARRAHAEKEALIEALKRSNNNRTLAARILGMEPELVLLGTGPTQIFPAAGFGATFMRAGIGYEVMNTAAACRTFNVLVAEQRRALALLMV